MRWKSLFSLDGTPRNEDAKESDRSSLRWNEMEVEEQNEVAVKQQLALELSESGSAAAGSRCFPGCDQHSLNQRPHPADKQRNK